MSASSKRKRSRTAFAQPALRRRAAQDTRSLWAFRVFLAALPVLCLVAAGMRYWGMQVVARDLEGATPQYGTAIVRQLVPVVHTRGLPVNPPSAWVEFHGRLYQADRVKDYALLQTDAPASIEYRIGKSGKIYVDRVEPLSRGVTPP